MKKSTQLLLFALCLAMGVLLDLAPIKVPDGIDKIYHLMGFSLMTFLTITTYVSFFGKKSINCFLMFLVTFGGVFAGIAEFLQKFVLIRECSVDDWITNLLGITLIVVIAFLHYSKEKQNMELNEGRFEFKDLPAIL